MKKELTIRNITDNINREAPSYFGAVPELEFCSVKVEKRYTGCYAADIVFKARSVFRRRKFVYKRDNLNISGLSYYLRYRDTVSNEVRQKLVTGIPASLVFIRDSIAAEHGLQIPQEEKKGMISNG